MTNKVAHIIEHAFGNKSHNQCFNKYYLRIRYKHFKISCSTQSGSGSSGCGDRGSPAAGTQGAGSPAGR